MHRKTQSKTLECLLCVGSARITVGLNIFYKKVSRLVRLRFEVFSEVRQFQMLRSNCMLMIPIYFYLILMQIILILRLIPA